MFMESMKFISLVKFSITFEKRCQQGWKKLYNNLNDNYNPIIFLF